MTLGNSGLAEQALAEISIGGGGGSTPGGGGGGPPQAGGAFTRRPDIKPGRPYRGKPSKPTKYSRQLLDDFQQYWEEVQEQYAKAEQAKALRLRTAQAKAARRQAAKDAEAARQAARKKKADTSDQEIAALRDKLAAALAVKQQRDAAQSQAAQAQLGKLQAAAQAAQKQEAERAANDALAAAAKAERDVLLEKTRRWIETFAEQDKNERDITLQKLMKELERAQNEYEAVALLLL